MWAGGCGAEGTLTNILPITEAAERGSTNPAAKLNQVLQSLFLKSQLLPSVLFTRLGSYMILFCLPQQEIQPRVLFPESRTLLSAYCVTADEPVAVIAWQHHIAITKTCHGYSTAPFVPEAFLLYLFISRTGSFSKYFEKLRTRSHSSFTETEGNAALFFNR